MYLSADATWSKHAQNMRLMACSPSPLDRSRRVYNALTETAKLPRSHATDEIRRPTLAQKIRRTTSVTSFSQQTKYHLFISKVTFVPNVEVGFVSSAIARTHAREYTRWTKANKSLMQES